MKIGHITTHWLPVAGGQESYLALLFEVLDRAGHEQHVYQYETGCEHPALRTVPRPPRALLALREGTQYWLYDALLPLRFADLAREELLIVHFPVHYPAVSWHPRLLVLSHGVEWDQPALRLPHRLRRAIARRAWSRAHVVVANDSNFLREMGLDIAPGTRLFEEVANRRFFLPNAIDPTRFHRVAPLAGLEQLEPVLVPRNIWPARGIDLAIEAWARVAPEQPRSNLVIAGDFWDLAYKDRLFKLARKLGVSGRVLYTGPLAWEDMPAAYAAARITLIPSVRSEGSSLAALESMACGTPVVTTNVGGLADLPGLQSPPTPEALACSLRDAFARREALARQQQTAVLERFSLERWREAWLTAVGAATR